ncbi:cupin [Virgisporangium aliadipatigenens]|uniref:Cupin n=1 Tax=Virgisporangium aliadipatigenens TaxID=741659 RepID=A0A8J4DNF6_9ACTN|nr:cupin domain-containing protein [Virgisporangium aliadipatigenens]GIJ43528.1 cupin [Virgisporangium aliadipatigenens]
MSRTRIIRRAGATLAAAAAALSLLGAPARATPPDPGVTGTILWQKTVGDQDLTLREIHLPPHTDTGWHYHDGTLFAWVKEGTLSHFDSTCASDGVYPKNSPIVEAPGSGNVHIGRNLGDTELVLHVLYVLPTGSPFSRDAPNPGCPFE